MRPHLFVLLATTSLAGWLVACAQGMECGAGQVACGNRCVDLSIDEENCGACGNVCSGIRRCVYGSCLTPGGGTQGGADGGDAGGLDGALDAGLADGGGDPDAGGPADSGHGSGHDAGHLEDAGPSPEDGGFDGSTPACSDAGLCVIDSDCCAGRCLLGYCVG